MDLYKALEDNNLLPLLHKVDYVQPEFSTFDKVRTFINDIIDNNRKTLIVGDYDVDGLMCALCVYDSLTALRCTNVKIFNYVKRTHLLDANAVTEAIRDRYEYCIICDCGSHDLGLLKKLIQYGVKVVLLDHHQTIYSYVDYDNLGDIAIINTTLEPETYYLSAGALCYCVFSQIFQEYSTDEGGISAYGCVSLFSDCMNMRNELNRAIYYRAVSLPPMDIPKNVTLFMNEYSRFNSRYISWWFSPRINAMFRSENLQVLNNLFLKQNVSSVVLSECLQEINEKYETVRDMCEKVTDVLEVEELENFVIADVYSASLFYDIEENYLWNYTGVIANRLSERFGKTAFVYCRMGNNVKGSIRDLYGREYLPIFSQIGEASGHAAAFATKVSILDLQDYLVKIQQINDKYALTDINNQPIIIDYPYTEPDRGFIEDVATINEFAGVGVPSIILRKQRIGAIKETKTKYGYTYLWGDYRMNSQYAKSFGSYMMLRPYRAATTKIQVQ